MFSQGKSFHKSTPSRMKQKYREPPVRILKVSSAQATQHVLSSLTWKESSYSIAFTETFHEKTSATWAQDARMYAPPYTMSTSHELRKVKQQDAEEANFSLHPARPSTKSLRRSQPVKNGSTATDTSPKNAVSNVKFHTSK